MNDSPRRRFGTLDQTSGRVQLLDVAAREDERGQGMEVREQHNGVHDLGQRPVVAALGEALSPEENHIVTFIYLN